MLTTLLVKKNLRKSYFALLICNLRSCPLVKYESGLGNYRIFLRLY